MKNVVLIVVCGMVIFGCYLLIDSYCGKTTNLDTRTIRRIDTVYLKRGDKFIGGSFSSNTPIYITRPMKENDTIEGPYKMYSDEWQIVIFEQPK